jgi:large subunit ribosomal protein L21
MAIAGLRAACFCRAFKPFKTHKNTRLKEAGPAPSEIGNEHEDRKMFAVIKAGGKQYRVAPEDVIRIDRVSGAPGEIVEFGEVLVLGGDAPQLGTPTISGATVAGEVLQHTRGDKVIAFKKRRRKNSRRKRGYRHEFSVIRITEILTDGAKPSKEVKPRPKREAKPKVEGETTTAPKEKTAKSSDKGKPKARAKKPAAKKPAKSATKGKKK